MRHLGLGGLVLLLGLGGFYGYMGGFSSVEVKSTTFETTEIFYSTHRGSYKNLETSWTQFAKEFQALGVEDCDALGVYLDGPESPEETLRTVIGCRMDGMAPDLKEKLKEKFKTFTLPQAEAFMASFPYRNMFSFWLAPMKVYPQMQNLMATNRIIPSVSIEVYGTDKGRSQIHIYLPSKMTPDQYQSLYDAF